jgi:hypothetical protein
VDDAGRMEPLLETADVALLPIIKSVLDAAEIPYVVQGDEALGLLPLTGVGRMFSHLPVSATILVPAERLEEARALIEVDDNQD